MPSAIAAPAAHNQLALFAQGDCAQTAAQTSGKTAPIALPIQVADEVPLPRVKRIFRVPDCTVHHMLERGLIRGYFMPGTGGANGKERRIWHIDYASVVEYCDRLRVLHCISPSTVGPRSRNLRGRRRDDDLLPFPASEETTLPAVARRLQIQNKAVLHLLESGHLVGYQVLPGVKGSPWRIHAPSVDAYILALHRQLDRHARKPSMPRG